MFPWDVTRAGCSLDLPIAGDEQYASFSSPRYAHFEVYANEESYQQEGIHKSRSFVQSFQYEVPRRQKQS